MKKFVIEQKLAKSIAILVFIATTTLGIYWTNINRDLIETEQTLLLNQIATTQAAAIERRLTLSLAATQVLSQEIIRNQGRFENFEAYARNTMSAIGGLANLQLAPDGIISAIYPAKGNESAIGLNILEHPVYREATQESIRSRQLMIAGPFELVQGGIALLGRKPVFITQEYTQKDVFWGFVSAMIFLDDLLAATDIVNLEQKGYAFELSRQQPELNQRVVFASSTVRPVDNSVNAAITLPNGDWRLTISRQDSAQNEMIGGYLLSIAIGLIAAMGLYAILLQPFRLRELVQQKTIELKKLAYTDPLTNLANRRQFSLAMENTISRCLFEQKAAAFIYFDLDNFKRINDTIGHDVGDKVLCITAQRIQDALMSNDVVARLGGDEFGVILTNVASVHQVEQWCQNIFSSISPAILIDNKELFISTSLGVVMIPYDGTEMVSLMQHADMALYEAKHLGRGRYCFYSQEMRERTLDKIRYEEEIHTALLSNQFVLYYQPQISLRTGNVIGAEALIRWQHPQRGMVPPDQFIGIAEQTGQIIPIGYWVIQQACHYLRDRQQRQLPQIPIHVNLSALQLSDPNLPQFLADVFEQSAIDTQYFGIEITETALLNDANLALSILTELKAMGVSLAIDDFGIGYSSLGLLKNLPFDTLKIDRSFVMDLEEDHDDRKIVEAIIAMSHKLNLHIVAEGIETPFQREMLSSFACDAGQGYLISRPIPSTEFDALANRGDLIFCDPFKSQV